MLSKPTQSNEGFVSFPVFLLLLIFVICGLGIAGFTTLTHTNPLSPHFLEESPPSIEWLNEPSGVGADAIKIRGVARDLGAGVDEVIARLIQNDGSTEIFRFSVGSDAGHEVPFEIPLDAKKLGLKEGRVEIQMLVFDRSLWSNGTNLSRHIEANYQKPNIEVITPQQNAVRGGVELVFYRVLGKTPVNHGVQDTHSLYPGFKASAWGKDFSGYARLYFSIFPLTHLSVDSAQTSRLRIIARDSIGNSAQSDFNYRVKERKLPTFKSKLNATQGDEILRALVKRSKKLDPGIELSPYLPIAMNQDEATITHTLESSSEQIFWKGAFLRPVNEPPTWNHGDTQLVFYNDKEIWTRRSNGARFNTANGAPVRAANHGRLLWQGQLALLGNTVIIDHGAGLSTIYANLSEIITKNTGQEIASGAIIGRAGQSGIPIGGQGGGVHFEIRLHGVPVNPQEWWDPTWIKDHIENKLALVQSSVGGEGS